MSVAEYLCRAAEIEALTRDMPECWALVSNHVYARAEEQSVVAVFDTLDLARAYAEASLLPPELWSNAVGYVGGYGRTYRPDSLLWDCNDAQPVLVTMCTKIVSQAPPNPLPPTGPVPQEVFAAEAARRLAESSR